MKIAISQPVLSAISAQTPGTPLSVGVTGTGIVGQGFRLPDHVLEQPFIKTLPLGGSPIPTDGADQMSEELQKIVYAIADLCGAPTPPDVGGTALNLANAFGEGRTTIDLIKVGIDAGDLVSMALPGVKPISVTLNLIKIGSGLFGIWHRAAR